MPRPMLIGGRTIRAAVTHNFVVDPGSRHTLAAIQLIQTFLSGPQDFSLADGNATARKLWEGMGGTTLLSHSLRWIPDPAAGSM